MLDLLQNLIDAHLDGGGVNAELVYRSGGNSSTTRRKNVKVVAVDETGVAYSYEDKLRIMTWRVIIEIELNE